MKKHPSAGAALRRLVLLIAVVCGIGAAGAGSAEALGTIQFKNPIRNGLSGQPLSCPDPSVIGADRGHWRYFLFCTSDNGKNAFPIWMSEDLVHWYPDGFVFPHGKQPWWAVHSTGGGRNGIFWAPSIYRIENKWVLYFAAQYNAASHAAGSAKLKPGTMVLGVATAGSLSGPWHTKLLHFPGELNNYNPRHDKEIVGGDIDPGVVRDPRTGRLYIFWAEQSEQIWEGALSADGTTISPTIRVAFRTTEPWECDPLSKKCTVEGPEPFYYDGKIYVLYSAASTWDSTYAVGVASSTEALDSAAPFVKDAEPILRSGNGFMGPGGESDPVIGPRGQPWVFYHALLKPTKYHNSGSRVLMLGSLHWADGWPLINNGEAH